MNDLIPIERIENKILLIRGQKVLLDRDLAELYGVEVKYLKRQVRRNFERFPEDFMFELNKKEFENWRSQFGTSNDIMGLRYSPMAFTEQGINTLSKILKKDLDVDLIFNSNRDISKYNKNIDITSKIYTIRGFQVMIDYDLGVLYQVETRVINQAIKRNSERFPNEFMFQLNKDEYNNLKSQSVISSLKHRGKRTLPFVFTEQGIAMLSAVLHSPVAIATSIKIMSSFIDMRNKLANNSILFNRLDNIERNQITYQVESDKKFDELFDALESKKIPQEKGIFFNGEMFDAYSFVADTIRSANKSIILIDNYIDDTVLTQLTKRNKNVTAIIYTKHFNKQLKLD